MCIRAKSQVRIPNLWLLAFLTGSLSEDVRSYRISGYDPWVDGALCTPSPPSSKPQDHRMELCSKGGDDQSLTPTSICSVPGRRASVFKHSFKYSSHSWARIPLLSSFLQTEKLRYSEILSQRC